jgi:hypothetical protein
MRMAASGGGASLLAAADAEDAADGSVADAAESLAAADEVAVSGDALSLAELGDSAGLPPPHAIAGSAPALAMRAIPMRFAVVFFMAGKHTRLPAMKKHPR